MTDVIESVCSFDCAGERLQAVLARPPVPVDWGVVIVVGGPQYRAGSHRQFVGLARALAGAGFAAMRFDCRGMGDSGGEARSFEAIDEDIAAAVDALVRALPGLRRVVLWGLCDGASAALLYVQARRDPRISGLCLLNPWVRSENALARTHVRHYYGRRVLQRDFWIKLLRGGVALAALKGFVQNLRLASAAAAPGAATFRERMAAAWHTFDGSILLLLSEKDLTAREFVEHVQGDAAWRGAWQRARLSRHELPGADHTVSAPQSKAAVETQVVEWLRQLAAAGHG